MKRARYACLVFRALYEIARYDAIVWLRGSGRILPYVQPVAARPTSHELEQAICNAVPLATCFYWKPVLCCRERSVLSGCSESMACMRASSSVVVPRPSSPTHGWR